jgi:hypothetical protein
LRNRPPIGLGDFLRASEELGARDAESRKRIAKLLGFDWAERPQRGPRDASRERAPENEETTEEAQAVVTETPADSRASGAGREEQHAEAGDLWVETLPSRGVRMPEWVAEVEAMPEPVGEETDEPVPIEPLFAPGWTRAILFAALAHVDRRGPVDVERTVELLCRSEPLTRLPRRTRFHLKNDLQLLIDVNRTMAPFVQDQLALVSAVGRLVSAQNVERLLFSACPTRGAGRAGEWPWGEYVPPKHPGTLVLVLTDLGMSRAAPGVENADADEWLRFAGMIRRDGCQLVTLVPFPRRRVPASLKGAMAVVPWDRTTTVGMIRKIRLSVRQDSVG